MTDADREVLLLSPSGVIPCRYGDVMRLVEMGLLERHVDDAGNETFELTELGRAIGELAAKP